MHDVVIIGGSHAGLSAALVLGRAGRRVLVIDGGSPRSVRSASVHAFHTRDGEHSTVELLQIARDQLAMYPNVTLERGEVGRATQADGGFCVATREREQLGRMLVLATGVRDVLPPIVGLDALWGTLAIRCPYCDAWELRDHPLAVIGNDEQTLRHLRFVRLWSERLTLYTNGRALPADAADQLAVMGVRVVEAPITEMVTAEGMAEIAAGDQRSAYRGVFLWPVIEFQNSLAQQLGCAVQACGAVVVDPTRQTTTQGVYAVGDLVEPEMHMVALAASTGLQAAFAINTALFEQDDANTP